MKNGKNSDVPGTPPGTPPDRTEQQRQALRDAYKILADGVLIRCWLTLAIVVAVLIWLVAALEGCD